VEPDVVVELEAEIAGRRDGAAAAAEVVARGGVRAVGAADGERHVKRHAQKLARIDAAIALALRERVAQSLEQGVIAAGFVGRQTSGAAVVIQALELVGELGKSLRDRRRA